MGKDNSRRLTKRSESARFTFNLFLHLHFTLPRVVDQDVPVTGGAAVHAGGRGATKGPLLHLLPDRRAAFAVRTTSVRVRPSGRPVVDTAPHEQRNENEYFRGGGGRVDKSRLRKSPPCLPNQKEISEATTLANFCNNHPTSHSYTKTWTCGKEREKGESAPAHACACMCVYLLSLC